MITPYDFQMANITEMRSMFARKIMWVLWYLPTGAGKSTAATWMILEAMKRGKCCWFIVHRRELLRQVERLFKGMGIDYGMIASGYPQHPSKIVQICSINTLARRIDKINQRPNLAVLDESHHCACDSWSGVLGKLGPCYGVGLSASPIRQDGRGLAKYFQGMVKGPSIRELISQGYLSAFRTFAPPTVDTSGLHVRAGDYITAESEALMDKPAITGSAVSEYRKLCDGKRAIVFCTSIKHSQHVAEEFRSAGYRAAHVDGTTDANIRDLAIQEFEEGKLQLLCNVDIAGEGLSINAIECVILLRPTASLGLFIQQVGRGLRTWPGKSALTILDHVGSSQKFGLIDEDRDWQLTYDEDARKSKPKISVRVCPKCFAASSSRARVCTNPGPPACGYEFPIEAREVEQREGELVELTAEQLEKRHERMDQGRAQGLDQLLEFAKRKGRSPQWAMHVWQAREAKRIAAQAKREAKAAAILQTGTLL